MPSPLDSSAVDVPCPGCGHKNRKTVGWLKTHDQMTCGGCGKVVQLESSGFRKGMREVDASLKKLTDTFKKLGR
jgi:ribosomal protein S27E